MTINMKTHPYDKGNSFVIAVKTFISCATTIPSMMLWIIMTMNSMAEKTTFASIDVLAVQKIVMQVKEPVWSCFELFRPLYYRWHCQSLKVTFEIWNYRAIRRFPWSSMNYWQRCYPKKKNSLTELFESQCFGLRMLQTPQNLCCWHYRFGVQDHPS